MTRRRRRPLVPANVLGLAALAAAFKSPEPMSTRPLPPSGTYKWWRSPNQPRGRRHTGNHHG